MNRWSQYDEDDYRLPEGIVRIGYDSDTGIYTYIDQNGDYWTGAPGARYGALRRLQTTYAPSCSRADNLRAPPAVEVEGVFDNFDKIENGEKNKNDDDEKNKDGDDGSGATLGSRFFAPFGFLRRMLTQRRPSRAGDARSDVGAVGADAEAHFSVDEKEGKEARARRLRRTTI